MMTEQLTIRQSLTRCAEEFNQLQNGSVGFIEVEQRHGRLDGALVDLHDRNGFPVMSEDDNGRSISVGQIGGVCLNCPILEAGDGCALQDSLQQLAAELRDRRDRMERRSFTNTGNASPAQKRTRARRKVAEVIVKHMPPEHLSAEDREARSRRIAEESASHEDIIKSIYKAQRTAHVYPGATSEPVNRLNDDYTDHISADQD